MSNPKGVLIAIGGDVDKGQGEYNFGRHTSSQAFYIDGILLRFISEMRGKDSVVEIITTASEIPEEVGESYVQAFERLGCRQTGLMHIKTREDAQQNDYLKRIAKADGILFTGGNQMRLTTILGGTDFMAHIMKRYFQQRFVIAGTSAGAMAMSSTMIYEGSSDEALLKGKVKITTGLGFMNNVIIDSHFVKRGRFGRLTQAVCINPACIGIGLGEDTAVLVRGGHHLEAVGSGLVLIFDGHEINYCNIASLKDGEPISIEHMVVHVLAKGNVYDVISRRFESSGTHITTA